jgi:hypothetical protein
MAALLPQVRSAIEPDDATFARPSLWRRAYVRFGAHIGFGTAGVLLIVGWLYRDAHAWRAGDALGYSLGVLALSCMLLLLMYPLRKRLRFLSFLGATKHWFRTHMILGTSGPLLALYHCNFTIGSFNSRVALVSALLVACSGFVGRYIYAKIHQGLYGRRTDLKELLARVQTAAPIAARLAQFVPELTRRLVDFDRHVLVPPTSLLGSVALPFKLAVITRLQYWKLMRFTRRRLLVEGILSARLERNGARLEEITRNYIRDHLRHVRRVAEFTAYQRLFALWHTIHRPFFVVLLLSVAVHVFAVHYYSGAD